MTIATRNVLKSYFNSETSVSLYFNQMSLGTISRVDGVTHVKDKICDVIYRRQEEKQLTPLLALFAGVLSARQMSLINQDINGLFDTLLRLNLGSIHNLWAFTQIADFLRDQELTELLSRVNQMIVPEQFQCLPGRNLYAFSRANNTPSTPTSVVKNIDDSPAAPGPSTTTPSPSQTLRQKRSLFLTFDLLVRDLGKRWRDLGRSLGYHEAELDEFEERNSRDLRARIHDMLEDFSRRHPNTDQMLFVLCTALEQCRRVDLRKKVQQVISSTI